MNNVELACVPFYGSWLNRIETQFTTHPKLRQVIRRAETIKQAKVA